MQHLPPVQPGCIVEFLQDNQPVIAWVLEAAAGKVRVFTVGQREAKLPSSRLLPWTGPQYSPEASRHAMLETLRAHASRRQTLAQDIDALEIWELAQGELVQADILWLGSLLFTQPEPDQLAALGHKLLHTKTHFRFTPPHFEIFPLDVVQRRQEEMHRAEERRRLVGFGQEFLRALWDQAQGKPSKLPTPDPEQEAQLRQLLHARISTPEDRESETLWKTMAGGLPEDPWMPLILAETWGIVPRHYNAYLARADYTWGPEWADPFASEIEAIIHNVQQIDIPPEPTPFLTVDAATTQDIDDGFWVAREEEGWRVLLALACPALGWSFGSALDEAVRHRFSSLYLPEGTSHMLPERLGTDAFSLRAGEPRAALVIECTVHPEGVATAYTTRLRRACVAANTTYEAVEQSLDAQPSSMLAEALAAATALRQHRIAEGAVITEQSDPYIVLEGDGPLVRIRSMTYTPRAQTIVSEFMILANSVLAAWGQEIGLPLLFRTQNITVPAECAGVWSEPHDIYRVVGRLGPSLLETTPRRHATVAANPYATLTSPLRRYVDLVNMAQILAGSQGRRPVFSQADLEALLPALCQRAELVGQVQRARTRYWKFEYLRQRAKNRQFPAIIVDATPVVVTVAMPDLCLFLKAPRKVFGDKLRLGQRFHIRLGRVDPLAGEARVIEAWEV